MGPRPSSSSPASSDDKPTVLWACARGGEAKAAESLLKEKTGAHFEDIFELRTFFGRQCEIGGYRVILAAARNQVVLSSGVCAGDRKDLELGDLVVVARAFSTETGSKITPEGSRPSLDQSQVPAQWHTFFERCALDFSEWPQQRPLSLQHQERVYTRFFLALTEPKEYSTWLSAQGYQLDKSPAENEGVLTKLMPSWLVIGEKWASSTAPATYGLPEPPADLQQEVKRALCRTLNFPRPPREPKAFFANMHTGYAVRADGEAFSAAKQFDRNAIGLDMEAESFYRQCSIYAPGLPALLAKGVVDHADTHKDDQFHAYGNKVAASFLYYVLSRLQERPK